MEREGGKSFRVDSNRPAVTIAACRPLALGLRDVIRLNKRESLVLLSFPLVCYHERKFILI